MRDLTSGSITRHLLGMSAFIGLGLLVQTLYFLVDLYFVARLGEHAVAGVGAAGNAYTLSMALGQLISIGGLSLIARSLGSKDTEDAGLVFNQAVGLSLAAGLLSLVAGYTLGAEALRGLGADEATAQAGRDYLFAFLPALALMFPAAAISSGLRAAGVVGPPMMIQSAALGLNVLLAPVLISGWLTGVPMGVAGAGLASSIAAVVGVGGILLLLFLRMPPHLRLDGRLFRPKLKVWGRIAGIGLPAAGEFFLMFVVVSVIYWVIRDFGPAAQAGFGIGSRVMQAIFLPAMALAFAAAPIAGQNFGARDAHRVRATFRQAALLGAGLMACLTVLCQLWLELLIAPFTRDPDVVDVARGYLRFISWNFVAVGLVFACSGLFQALGNTRPALISSASRLLTFALPALWLSQQPGFRIEEVWLLSMASVFVQAVTSLLLLRREFGLRLGPLEGPAAEPGPVAAPAR